MNKPQERQIKHVKDVFPTNARPSGLASGPSVPQKRPTTYKKRTAPNPPSSASAVFGSRTTVNPLISKSHDRAATPNGAPIVPADVRSLKLGELNATVSSMSHSGSSGYQSDRDFVSATNTRNDENDFGEDECTLTFDEEEDAPAEGRFKSVYDEYQGEDFSRYLYDDDDAAPTLPVRHYTSHPHADVTATPVQVSKNEPSATSTKGRLAKRGLKERLRGLFTLTRSGRKQADKQREPVSSIFDFTYTDSKIGCSDFDEPVVPDADGGSAGRKSWWSKNTLSARSMSGNSDVMFTSRAISQSTPDIYDAVSFASAGDYGHERVNQIPGDADFESYRKSTLYKSNNGNVGKKCKRKQTLFQKLSNSLRRLDKVDREAIESYAEEYERSGSNVVVNPLTALPPDEDTYL